MTGHFCVWIALGIFRRNSLLVNQAHSFPFGGKEKQDQICINPKKVWKQLRCYQKEKNLSLPAWVFFTP